VLIRGIWFAKSQKDGIQFITARATPTERGR